MIIWSGFGFLPVVFLVVFCIAFDSSHDSGLAYSLLLTGVISGALGWWLRRRRARIVIDKSTGKELVLRPRHALFFIPMVYWGPIFIIGGICLLVKVMMKH